MPMTIGLLPCQQESFEHHEELSKLSNETDVFYVPLQNDFTNHQDLSDLTKRFDEDILNKHLVVTFREIGYSLFLDSVKSIPDQNDHSKTHVTGKMIVDGICVQFLGRFDYRHSTHIHSDVQQINGVGRVFLDEDYYRELSSNQISIDHEFAEQKIMQHQGRRDSMVSTGKSVPTIKARSRTISENILGKNHHHVLTSPPSSVSNSRSRLHSPSHMPYPLRSPRTLTHANKQQYQPSSPVNIDSSSVSRSSGFHSSFISPSSSVPSSYNENPIESPPQQHIQFLSRSPQFSSPPNNATTMPIRIPSSNVTVPPASLPPLSGLFPVTQSHSLPTYFLPQANLAYLTPGSSTKNANMYFITSANHASLQPLHIITSMDSSTLQFANTHLSPSSYTGPMIQMHPNPDSASFSPSKRHDQDEARQAQPMETNKQLEEQLPFKKRRYAGQQPSTSIPMDIHQFDDDEGSNESMKK